MSRSACRCSGEIRCKLPKGNSKVVGAALFNRGGISCENPMLRCRKYYEWARLSNFTLGADEAKMYNCLVSRGRLRLIAQLLTVHCVADLHYAVNPRKHWPRSWNIDTAPRSHDCWMKFFTSSNWIKSSQSSTITFIVVDWQLQYFRKIILFK